MDNLSGLCFLQHNFALQSVWKQMITTILSINGIYLKCDVAAQDRKARVHGMIITTELCGFEIN